METFAIAALLVVTGSLGFVAGWAVATGRATTLLRSTRRGGGLGARWRRLQTVQAFDMLYQRIGKIRDFVLAESMSEQEVIQGMRFILRCLAMVTDITMDGNITRPAFVRMDSDNRKVGGDNPDAEYGMAVIDGRYDYRITGNRGDVAYFSFTVTAGRGVSSRRMVAFINDKTIHFDEGGDFTLLLSKSEPRVAGQWLPIPEDATAVLLRQYILDRKRERLPRIRIEVLGDDPGVHLPDDAEMAERLVETDFTFRFIATLQKRLVPRAMSQPNTFVLTDSNELGASIASPDNLYSIGFYEIADDEALIVDLAPPPTAYWNFAVESIWHESVDYLHRRTSLTRAAASYRPDGSIRCVIAKRNPGVDNWLDTVGLNRGFMIFRWTGALNQTVISPQVKLAKLHALNQWIDREPGRSLS